MNDHTITVLRQLLQLLPFSEFDAFVGQHQADRYVKHFSCRNQLTVMLYAQASGKDSLRNIETGLRAMGNSWYHLGLENVSRNTLAHANTNRSWKIYESLFYALLKKCREFCFGTASFSFQNELYAIDSTTVDLCLSMFPWAHFRREKGAIKLHTLFNVRSQIPELVTVTDGKVQDITAIRDIDVSHFPKGTIFVFDRGYTDYDFFWKIKEAGHHFVIRLKKGAQTVHLLGFDRPAVEKGVLKDENIAFILPDAVESYPDDLRLVTYHDEKHDQNYEFLTNIFDLSAGTIALIYKNRWQIELFFKWIKQHLKIKTFLGTSKNAVLIQIWIAMIYYLLLAWIKHQTKFKGSLHDLTILVCELLMHRTHLIDMLGATPKTISRFKARDNPQLALC